jgi:hypothetical protein
MKTPTHQAEINCQNEIARATKHLEFIHTYRDALNALGLKPSFWSDYCDFDNLTRPDLLHVLKAFPGKWDKSLSLSGSGITYTLTEPVLGLTIRCYNGEAPPSCVIEETVEYKTVPARVERIVTRKVKCPDPEPVQ